ncbi:MAG: hypothetical protein ABJE95_29570 [Byssovorax sp.]
MRTSPVLPAIVAAATIALVHGCTLPLTGLPVGAGGDAAASATSAGGGTSTAAATTSGGGSMTTTSGPTTASATASSSSTGAPPECSTKPDCPADGSCSTYDCVGGTCMQSPANEGVKISDPDGNCLKTVCVGGELKIQTDDMDVGSDGDPCTVDGCSNGAATHPPGNDGDSCGAPGKHCFSGQCLECADPTQCPQAANACTVATCDSGLCGFGLAPDGTSCANGNACNDPSTCAAGACVPHPKSNGGSCASGFGKCVDGGCCASLLVCGNGNTCCNFGQTCNPGQQCK